MQYTYSYLTDLKFGYGQKVPDYTPFNPKSHDFLHLDFFIDAFNNNEYYFQLYRSLHDRFEYDNLTSDIKKHLAVDNRREEDIINDSVPKQNSYADSFFPLRFLAHRLIQNSKTTDKTFNSLVYPLLYQFAVRYIRNTDNKHILIGNPYSLQLKAVPYITRFKGKYIEDTNHKLNLEIPYLAKYNKFHFLTITVDPKLYNNIDEARIDLSKLWNRVWLRIKNRYERANFHLYFIKTFEFQANSYPHIHVLIGGVGKIPSNWLRSIKGMNKRWFKSIYLRGYDYKGAFRYVFKYVIKNTAYIDSSNEYSIIDSLTPDNPFLKEKIISWALNLRIFSHSQHGDNFERVLTNSVNSRKHLRYPYSTLFNPLLHSPLKLDFFLHTDKKLNLFLYNGISTSSHLKFFVRMASPYKHGKGRFRKLTFKIRTFIFKPVSKNNSKLVTSS